LQEAWEEEDVGAVRLLSECCKISALEVPCCCCPATAEGPVAAGVAAADAGRVGNAAVPGNLPIDLWAETAD
jgi:hypothetical protein